MHMRTEDEGWQKESELEKAGFGESILVVRRRRGGTSWTRERNVEYALEMSAHESGAQGEAIYGRVEVLTVDLYCSCGWFIFTILHDPSYRAFDGAVQRVTHTVMCIDIQATAS